MKNKKGDYTLLKKELTKKTFIVFGITLFILILLNHMFTGRLGTYIVEKLSSSFYLDYESSFTIYTKLFRSNKLILMMIFTLIMGFIMFKILLNNIIKYLDEVSFALDKMSKDTSEEISLSKELQFLESRLNKTRTTILERERLAKLEEERKNDLVLYLAHDLKTPLTSIIGYLSLLSEVNDMDVYQRAKYTNITLDKANRLENLINEFFEITRYNINKIVLYKDKIDLSLMFEQMVEELYPLTIEKNNQINLNINHNLELWGDSDKLGRVFNNILKNAVNYSFDSTSINVSINEDTENVLIEIQNQGEDISEAELNNIFDMFYRADTSRSSKTGGSGLGLAISKEIVKAHGGNIFATSNDGLINFKIILPK